MGYSDRRSGAVPFGRLSPVSETDSESLHTNNSSELRPRPLNFSRPRPVDLPSSRNVQHDTGSTHTTSSSSSSGSSNVRSIRAFHEPASDLPDEPRFSLDSDRPDTPASATETPDSAASEFDWDGQFGELQPRSRLHEYDQQRSYTIRGGTQLQPLDSGSTAAGSDQPLMPDQPGVAELYGSEPLAGSVSQQSTRGMPPRAASQQGTQSIRPSALRKSSQQSTRSTRTMPPPAPPQKQPRIVKRTSFDQQSERMSINSSTSSSTGGGSRSGWEDNTSHHTLSANGNAGAQLGNIKRFNSSDHDISMLSEKEIAKLKKKGINPQLYMEMKAARKGKGKWVGPLVGNTYIG